MKRSLRRLVIIYLFTIQSISAQSEQPRNDTNNIYNSYDNRHDRNGDTYGSGQNRTSDNYSDNRHDRNNDRLKTVAPTPSPTESPFPSYKPSTVPTKSNAPSQGPICRTTEYDKLNGNGDFERTRLRRSNLLMLNTRDVFENAITMKWFTKPKNAAHPKHFFCGTFRTTTFFSKMENEVIVDEKKYSFASQRLHIPEFKQSFIQHGSHLIPTESGLQTTDNPYYEIIIGAGRVWSEIGDMVDEEKGDFDDDWWGIDDDDFDDDDDWDDDEWDDDDDHHKGKDIEIENLSLLQFSRASFPFTLVETNNDCTHNGVMTFLYNDVGQVSNAAYEIVKETCPYFKANMWGIVRAQYDKNIFNEDVNSIKIQNDFEDQVRHRIAMKPISRLSKNYDMDLSFFGKSNDLTVHAYDIDGVSYVDGFQTRMGKYPYPGK